MKYKTLKLAPPAFYGLAGEVISAVLPHTEADEAALLIQLLACFGNVIDRCPYFIAEASKHYSNLYILIVGLSSKGRKGSSLNQILTLFDRSEDFSKWRSNCHIKGLSSSEGLINKICDSTIETKDPFEKITYSANDKRLLCLETEFANTLNVMRRTGSTLSALLRDAWDGTDLHTTTKGAPQKATNPHVSLIGHITYTELHSQINPVDIKNGLGNRFLFINSARSKQLPNGNPMPPEELNILRIKIQNAYTFATQQKEMKFTEDAQIYWNKLYIRVTQDSHGILADLTGREAAQIKRMAMIYSVMNSDKVITIDSLKAAEAVWDYNCESIKNIFGQSFGCYKLDRIMNILSEFGVEGRSRTDLINDTGKNYGIGQQLDFLEDKGLIFKVTEPTTRRPKHTYYLTEFKHDVLKE